MMGIRVDAPEWVKVAQILCPKIAILTEVTNSAPVPGDIRRIPEC